jgi:UDP-N-acetylmuramoyl-tripeptide--D-alanyl-D-alanine ligase
MAVVEMGINVPGEMSRLVRIGEPTVGLITNIHPAHLEGLGSLEGILQEKGKLWLGLGPDDLAVVNLDDGRLSEFSKKLGSRTVTYSLSNPSAQVRLAGDIEERDGCSLFCLLFDGVELQVRFPVLGRHQLMNALAAAATAWGMGEPLDAIGEALASHRPVKGRMQVHRLKDGRVLVDDTYNANPGSMLAALQAIRSSCGGRPITAVLGEMRELGSQSESIHADLGRSIADLGVTRLIALGEKGRHLCQGAREAGMEPSACIWASSHEEVIDLLAGLQADGEWILVKGSRAMVMERVVEGIVAA